MEQNKNQSSSSTEDVAHKAQETASTLVSQAQDVASTQASNQMSRAADALDSVARTLHDSGSDLSEKQPQVAKVADKAAERIESASQYLRQRDLGDIIADAESYARREPLLVMGAALAIGFMAARFLKASSPDSSNSAVEPYRGGRNAPYGVPYGSGSTIDRPMSGRFSSDDYAGPATVPAYSR